ncbi:hypothetical protein DK847_14700, partial [Aestuariivirga litoralis]
MAVAILVSLSGAAHAVDTDESKDPKLPVQGRNGSFSRSIPIEVPAFRGIAPELRLVYDSSASIRTLPSAGGELGVGWSLQGVSAIQRISGTWKTPGQDKPPSGRGVPAYGAQGFPADSFMLDGTELVSCAEVTNPSSTPSCATAAGGAFTSRFESFLRIRSNPAANLWEVTGRDGVKSLYTSLEGAGFDATFRWHLASVTDRRGNHVDYGWSCATGHCTIASIRAFTAGTSTPASEVIFHTEARPDLISYGDGRGMRAMTKRITAIQVKSAGTSAVVYRLAYQTSVSTGLSRLVEVQKFGSDAAIVNGIVVPDTGTRMPSYVMTYSDNGDSAGHPIFDKREDWTGPGVAAIELENVIDRFGFPNTFPQAMDLAGDFNGDGWAGDYYMPKTCFYAELPSPSNPKDGRGRPLPAYECIGPREHYANGSPAALTYPMPRWKYSKIAGKLPDSNNIVALGDFNGDSAMDFARVVSTAVESCNSDTCPRSWSFDGIGVKRLNSDSERGFGFLSKWELDLKTAAGQAGDFDGDGKDDYLLDDGRIALSDRNGDRDGKHVVDWGLRGIKDFRKKYRSLIADFNGDGRSDALIHKEKTTSYRIYLSTGAGLAAQTPFNLPKDATRQTLGDVNGDGLSDMIYSASGSIVVLFSNGTSVGGAAVQSITGASGFRSADDEEWENGPDGSREITGVGSGDRFGTGSLASSSQYTPEKVDLFGFTQFKMGDFNGDGRVDLAGSRNKGTGPGTGIARSTGQGFESQPSVIPGSRMVTYITDYNGDGADDIARANLPPMIGDPRLTDNYVWLSRSGQADLMTSFQEPLGGRTSVTYGPSAGTPGSRMPFNMQVVKSLTLDDGRGVVSTLSFAYEGGAWSRSERQFLGFQKVIASLPCLPGEAACPQQVRTFSQVPACLGQVLQEQTLDGPGGAVLAQTNASFAEDGQLPFTCLATSTESRLFGDGREKVVRQEFAHDLFGNTTQVIDHGVLDAPGDETLTTTAFAPNTGDYLVSCPAETYVFEGTSSSGRLLKGTRQSYDGAAFAQPPARCEKTQQDDWVSGGSWITTARWSYDDVGNRVTETDGVGNTTTTLYDGALRLYTVETRLPNYAADQRFRTLTAWNLTCGLPASQTDLNGQVTSFAYDALCRESYRSQPGGYEEWRGFGALGQPNAQFSWMSRSAPGGQTSGRWSSVYFDGFGRDYFDASMGPGATKHVSIFKTYNQRGNLASQTEPFYYDEPQAWKTFTYDKLDRLVRTTNPDGTSSSIWHGLGWPNSTEHHGMVITDEAGRRTIDTFYANGKQMKHIPFKGEVALPRGYYRDGLGRITWVVDPAGNTWSYAFDGLGRRTRVNDPDLGSWSYDYDSASRLIAQTDAKGQRTELSYDALSRVTTKLVRGTSGEERTTNAYDEARAGFFNLGQITSAVREAGGKRFAQAFDYDAAGRLAQRSDLGVEGRDFSQGFEYWPDGTLKRKRLADGSWTGTYLYDPAGRLFSIGNANAPSASEPGQFISSILYNARGQTTAIAYGGGVATSFSYNDARGFLTRVLTQKNGETLLDLNYARNAVGQVTAISSPDPSRAWAFSYDELGRLVSADNQDGAAEDRSYAYDDAGNLTANSGLCGGAGLVYPPSGSARPHAPVSICGAPVSYD